MRRLHKTKLWRWYLKRRFTKTSQEIATNEKKEPQRVLAAKMLAEIDSTRFGDYHSSSGESTPLSAPDKCMDDYIERIKSVTKIVQKEAALPSIDISPEMKELTVDSFLVSADGYYLDAEKAIERFKQAGLNLCQAMEPSDTAEYGVYEHNRRIASKLFTNIREVAKTMVEVSLTN